jgi:hypothetical protein
MADRAGGASGQAAVELVATVPALLAGAVVALQLLVLGYSVTLVDGAAEAGALAAAAGQPVAPAVRDALPGWAQGRVELSRSGGELRVSLVAPSPLEPLGARLRVGSTAWARPR